MAAVAKIQELLGGEPVTGLLVSELDVVRLVRRGMPPAVQESFLAATQSPRAYEPKRMIFRIRPFLRWDWERWAMAASKAPNSTWTTCSS